MMIGKNTPPALAVVLGIAGAIKASLTVSPYDNPNVLLPSHFTKYVAIRSPSPVLTNPLAKKNEITINQITSFVNAPKAAEKVRVLVITEAVRPMKAQAPTGRGLSTRPAMVERKMARSCHACGVTSTGRGTRNRTARPTAREIARGTGFAPWAGCGDGAGVDSGFGAAIEGEEEARTS